MVGSRTLLCVLVFVYCLCCCNGILVTKNMKLTSRPKAPIGELGVEFFENLLHSASPLPPILCVPGVGGSQLFATSSKQRPDPWYCGSSKNSYLIWLALGQLVPGPSLECWSSNMMLGYNTTTQLFSNASGVEIMVDNFGTTLGFEYLDPEFKSETLYFATLVNALLKLGYVRGQNLLGAPYDWRLSPVYLPSYFQAFQGLIEATYAVNETKVAIIAHSLGNLFFLSFLRTVTQEWKDKYILTFVAASPPWIGAFTAVQSLTSGYNFGIPYLDTATAKLVQRTFPSTYFLLPYPKYYGNQLLVTTPGKNYTSMNYQDLLTALGVADMYNPYTLGLNTADPYEPPGVNTFCFYGYNVSTVIQEKYTSPTFTKPTFSYGSGDGTVPVESLSFCQNWVGLTNQTLVAKGYEGQEHVGLLSYAPFIQDVINAILN